MPRRNAPAKWKYLKFAGYFTAVATVIIILVTMCCSCDLMFTSRHGRRLPTDTPTHTHSDKGTYYKVECLEEGRINEAMRIFNHDPCCETYKYPEGHEKHGFQNGQEIFFLRADSCRSLKLEDINADSPYCVGKEIERLPDDLEISGSSNPHESGSVQSPESNNIHSPVSLAEEKHDDIVPVVRLPESVSKAHARRLKRSVQDMSETPTKSLTEPKKRAHLRSHDLHEELEAHKEAMEKLKRQEVPPTKRQRTGRIVKPSRKVKDKEVKKDIVRIVKPSRKVKGKADLKNDIAELFKRARRKRVGTMFAKKSLPDSVSKLEWLLDQAYIFLKIPRKSQRGRANRD